MSTTKFDSKWTKLGEIPKDVTYGNIELINQHEFVIAPRNSERWGIYKYNTNSNELIQFIKYPQQFDLNQFEMTFNNKNEKLYLYNSTKEKLVIIDMKSHEFNSISVQSLGFYPSIVHAQNNIHIIGGACNSKHLIWKEEQQSFEAIHEFADIKQGIFAPKAVYLSRKQCILLFGGGTGDVGKSLNIQEFSFKTNKWRHIHNITFGMYHIDAVLTMNEKHVIMRCVYGSHKYIGSLGKIFILDINDDDEYIFRISKVSLPIICNQTEGKMVITGDPIKDNLLIHGVFRSKEFIHSKIKIPSMDIIGLIAKFYSSEFLHYFNFHRKENYHFVIAVDEIL